MTLVELVDLSLSAVLKTAGSSLRHYTPQSQEALREVMACMLLDAYHMGLDDAANKGAENEH